MSTSTYTFDLDRAGIDRLLNSTTGPVARHLTQLGNRMVTIAKADANVDTGLMRSRIEFRLEVEGGDLVGILAARTSYAYWVHEGHGSYGGNPFLVNAARAVLG